MKKKIITVAAVVIALVLLLPIPMRLKDGGSVQYKAVIYEVTKYHRLDLKSKSGYSDGWGIKILGIPIYNNVE